MKASRWIVLILVLALGAGSVLFCKALPERNNTPKPMMSSKDREIARDLVALLSQHYNAQPLNDDLSRKMFNSFIESLDGSKRFFLNSDIIALKKHEKSLDNELSSGTLVFFTEATNILNIRILQAISNIKEIAAAPIDLKSEDSLELDPKKRLYPENEQEFRSLWQKILRYETLVLYMDKTKKSDSTDIQANIEKQAREEASASLIRILERRLTDNYNMNRYLNSLAASHDPHTAYMPPADMEDFEIQLTGSFEGIGAQLREDGDYIKVQEIIPGTPAWKQGQLKAGDIILKVAQGSKEPADIVNMPVSDAVKLIRGKKNTEVRLTVKKSDGQIVIIPIIRGKIVMEESYARSAVLESAQAKKRIGYIYLPGFYTDMRNDGGRSSSGDVRAALGKLASQNIQGLILDLRNNGGGSLEDAYRMAGLFIESGPIVQVRDSSGDVRVYDDPDNDIVYNGPMVVLVNEMSASASEIVAAALQDYKRAVIVGSEQTFGKGTVQQLANLDRLGILTQNKNLGTIKLTIQKFYRVNGGSTQQKGVASDIVLPSPLGFIDFGERSLDNSLPYDTIEKEAFVPWNHPAPIAKLASESEARVKANPSFIQISEGVAFIRARNNRPVPLDLSRAISETRELQTVNDRLTNIAANTNGWVSTYVDYSGADADDGRHAKNMEWVNGLARDSVIQEAYSIVNDMLGL